MDLSLFWCKKCDLCIDFPNTHFSMSLLKTLHHYLEVNAYLKFTFCLCASLFCVPSTLQVLRQMSTEYVMDLKIKGCRHLSHKLG